MPHPRPDTTPSQLQASSEDGTERNSVTHIAHGFHLRPPPAPSHLSNFLTPDPSLFQTIHMGTPTIDPLKYTLTIDGLVRHPFSLSLSTLLSLPSQTITSFHECYGSPLKPPTTNLWRIGNVTWTGIALSALLSIAEPLPSATYLWSDGLDSGTFDDTFSDRYQKDLPLSKAMTPACLLAYRMNGELLTRERGGPVRLVVPGWFGTNSTKWVCRLSLQERRSSSLYTTRLYNEVVPGNMEGKMRPVWGVEINSMVVFPGEGQAVRWGWEVVRGWAWGVKEVEGVRVSTDGGASWVEAKVKERREFEWQEFRMELELKRGSCELIAQAYTVDGMCQPLKGRRNHVHRVRFNVV